MDQILSKSEFMIWRQNSRHLWARKHNLYHSKPSLFSQLSRQVDELAHQYLEQFIQPNLPTSQLYLNYEIVERSLKARIDGLLVNSENQAYIFEIKAGNKLTKDHLIDLAFQSLVVKEQFELERLFVILLNKYYTKADAVNLKHLFQVIEVTREVKNLEKDVANQVELARAVLDLESPDSLPACDMPDICPCPDICHPQLPEFSIYDMAHLPFASKKELVSQGIINLVDIPESKLSHPQQHLQLRLTRQQSVYLDGPSIKNELSKLVFPLYFLDYEACNLPIPQYPGHWPYSEVVFQFSLHKLAADGSLEQFDFLHLDQADPSQVLVAKLRQYLGQEGSIITWNKSYESRMHNQLARLAPEHLLFLLELNQRMYDLRDIFSKQFLVDYRFKGKTSLKNILPVLVPDLNHADLDIQRGDQASLLWYQLVFGNLSDSETEKYKQQLLEYCQLDTLGMVKIYQYLKSLELGS